eukprot:gb/GECG01015850.1/.p1 GENE.gb/GECG01015850.1/~~gb/GECG01015850.1/.p1  ORF type:complete len:114 (+),score=5.54 gb/GECG01015850.1/:1-342(+)
MICVYPHIGLRKKGVHLEEIWTFIARVVARGQGYGLPTAQQSMVFTSRSGARGQAFTTKMGTLVLCFTDNIDRVIVGASIQFALLPAIDVAALESFPCNDGLRHSGIPSGSSL